MRHRITMLAIAVAAFLGTGAALTTGPAQAAPATTYGPYEFFVDGTDNCIVTHGPGNQLTVAYAVTAGCASITLYAYGNGIYTFTDANGNCIRANSSGVVLLESGSCNTSDSAERWSETAASPFRFENQKQGSWLKVTGPASGDKVWVGTGGKNDWDLR